MRLPLPDLRRWVQSPRWAWAFAAGVTACLAVYGLNRALAGPDPGGAWGLAYGVAAVLLLLGALLLGVRRRTMDLAQRLPLGRTQDWVQLHVYGGTLFLLLVLMHSGFAWPRGTLTRWLLALSLWITASGLLGVALRKWIPPLLASGLTLEVLYERIPELTAEVRGKAEEVVATCSTPLKDFYRRRIARSLARPQMRWTYLFAPSGGIAHRLRDFEFLRQRLPPEERHRCDELATLYRTKLELDAHYSLQRPLRLWLYGHVPVSLALLVLVVAHVAAVWYF